MIPNKGPSCKVCGGKFQKKMKYKIYVPRKDSIYLTPASKICTICKSLYDSEIRHITRQGKIAVWNEEERRVIFEKREKIEVIFKNISVA